MGDQARPTQTTLDIRPSASLHGRRAMAAATYRVDMRRLSPQKVPCTRRPSLLAVALAASLGATVLYLGGPSIAAWCGVSRVKARLARQRAAPWPRTCAPALGNPGEPLKIHGGMHCGRLGDSIARTAVQGNDTILQSVGVKTASTAVKAGIFAAKALERMGGSDSHKDKLLVMSPSWKKVGSNRTVLETCYRLVEPKEPREASEGSEGIVRVSSETNPGLLAGRVKAVVLEKGEAVMRAVGANAIMQTLKATMLAEKYIRQDTGAEARLVLVPSFEDITGVVSDNVTTTSVRVRCFIA